MLLIITELVVIVKIKFTFSCFLFFVRAGRTLSLWQERRSQPNKKDIPARLRKKLLRPQERDSCENEKNVPARTIGNLTAAILMQDCHL